MCPRIALPQLVVLAALSASCGGEAPETRGEPARSPVEERRAPPPGEEPLATETLGEETVVTLPEERSPATPPPSPRRPCNWAKAWGDPDAAHPLLAGVGGVPMPARVSEAPIEIPEREPLPEGEIVVELVIRPDGSVGEAAVIRTTTPPWPEAEEAVLEAIRQWRFEEPKLDGTPIAVCTTMRIRP